MYAEANFNTFLTSAPQKRGFAKAGSCDIMSRKMRRIRVRAPAVDGEIMAEENNGVVSEVVQVDEERMKARVYLRAVVPLLEIVTEDVEKYRKMIAPWNCVVQIEVLGDEEAAVHMVIQNGRLKVEQGRHASPTIGLGFKTLEQMNITLGGGMSGLPKIKGMFHVILLVKVLLLLKSLMMLMPEFVAKNDAEKMVKVKLVLNMVTVAMQEMCNSGDEFIGRLVRGNKGKIIQWHVPNGPEAYVELQAPHIYAHKGKHKKRPYLLMKFKDLDSAYGVLTGELDAVQATAMQAMKLRGPSEYAMRVGNMMKRVENFLMPQDEEKK